MEDVARCPRCGGQPVTEACASCGAEPVHAPDDEIGERAASDRDKQAEARDRAAEVRDEGAAHRDRRARQQEQAARHENKHDQNLSDHDEDASARDQQSADDDQHAADADAAAGGDTDTHRSGTLARGGSRRQRDSASVQREETSGTRLEADDAAASREQAIVLAEHDRADAADDRRAAADDREAAARERVEALRRRTESASEAQRSVETLESLGDAFFTLDSEWRFTYLNPQAESLLMQGRRDLVGKIVWEAFPEAVGTESDAELRRALREQTPVRFEQTYESLGNTFEVRAYPVTGGLAVYFSDITTQRRLDMQLRQSQRLEALGRVTAGVAHDFNNLLTGIGGFASLGQAAAVDEETTGYFDEIDSAAQKAKALTRQLLTFARERDLAPAATNLNEVVEGISSLLRQLMPASVELRLALSPDPVVVFVDPSQLEQVLLNLVVNSRDAIDASGSITVKTATDRPVEVAHEADGPSGWLQIADTGCGIPDELRPRIFEPFVSTKSPETASGLGLATIHGIVSQSGGSIYVDSTVDVGTTFTVALPVEQPEPAAADRVGPRSSLRVRS